MKRYSALILFISALLITGCSGSINLVSSPADTKTIVDGDLAEWNNLTTIKNENLAFGIRNDNNYLYIAMLTGDRSKIMRIMTGGLQVWLDPEDPDNKIGIQYPAKPDPVQMRKAFEERMVREQTGRQGAPDFMASQKNIAILNDDDLLLEEYPAGGTTYQAKVTMDRERFAYELRIPIGENMKSPVGLKAKPGDKISIEILTGEFIPEGPGGGMGPDGAGRPPMDGGRLPIGGGGRPGRGMGGQGGGRPEMDMKPMNYEFNVTLR